MARGGDDHIIRRVALLEPGAQSIARKGGDSFRRSQNWLAQRMRRPEILREQLVDQVFGIVLGHANFFQDDGFFAVDFIFGEFRIQNHVRKDVESFGQMFIEDASIEANHSLEVKASSMPPTLSTSRAMSSAVR